MSSDLDQAMAERRLKAQTLLPKLFRALGFMQAIEEALRLYVGTCEELISAAAPYGVPFQVERAKIEAAAFGRVLGMFEKVNRNSALIERLRKMIPHRNYLAHTAFVYAVRGISDNAFDLDYAHRHAQEVGDEAEKLVALVAQEMRSILASCPGHDLQKIGIAPLHP